jgi:NADPH:quinone reductase-like Zn-dependent oxidoreductase
VELPDPQPAAGGVIIEVKAFGLNRAELYFRQGLWGDVAAVSGIECVGLIRSDPDGKFRPGQKVLALMGGMGRTINGSYAELTQVPAANVVAVTTALPWEELAALPESYATAWTCLYRNLGIEAGQTLLIRGATSALGQAATCIAAQAGVKVIGSTRQPERQASLIALGASDACLDAPDLSTKIRQSHPIGLDAVLDIVGNSSLCDSLQMVRPGGHVCCAGFLGGGDPVPAFDPLRHMPSGVYLSFFASAFAFGTADYPLSDIPFQDIVDRASNGAYQSKPAAIFDLAAIAEAHRLMESNQANGKIVVRV